MKSLKVDKTDRKILWHLDYDARMPRSSLAKKAGISKQNLNYRVKRLVREGVIKGFFSVIDSHMLGHLTYRVYFRYRNVSEAREKEIVRRLVGHPCAQWVASMSGSWDLEVVFTARNFVHFNNILKGIKEELGASFSKYHTSMSIMNYHFRRDHLLGKPRGAFSPIYYGFEPRETSLDDLDIALLCELSEDCARSNREIGRVLGVSHQTVRQRLARLERERIVQAHRIFVDMERIGKKIYKAAVFLDNPTAQDERALYAFCAMHPCVVYLVEVLGEWQMEIETEVDGPEEITRLLRDIRNRFPDLIKDFSILQTLREEKLNYLPMGREMLRERKEKKEKKEGTLSTRGTAPRSRPRASRS